jgi:SnoaL-like domain
MLENMGAPSGQALRQLLDKQEITEVLYYYARGVDRSDREALGRVYWPDADDDHIVFRGAGEALIDYLHTAVRGMRTAHRVTNVLIEFDGATSARVESYVWAYHNMVVDVGIREDVIFGGRYLDRFEQRQNQWRVASRRLVMDYFQHFPAATRLGVFGSLDVNGARYPDDPLYNYALRKSHRSSL